MPILSLCDLDTSARPIVFFAATVSLLVHVKQTFVSIQEIDINEKDHANARFSNRTVTEAENEDSYLTAVRIVSIVSLVLSLFLTLVTIVLVFGVYKMKEKLMMPYFVVLPLSWAIWIGVYGNMFAKKKIFRPQQSETIQIIQMIFATLYMMIFFAIPYSYYQEIKATRIVADKADTVSAVTSASQ